MRYWRYSKKVMSTRIAEALTAVTLIDVRFRKARGRKAGAGRSTLIEIIAGVHRVDEGRVIFEGKDIDIKGRDQEERSSIRIVCQELALSTLLDVPSNLLAGAQLTRRGFLQESKRRKQGNGNYTVHLR
jgi:ABC-type uncharacterized transport system ATPase subunit